jgi:hypothetical protein
MALFIFTPTFSNSAEGPHRPEPRPPQTTQPASYLAVGMRRESLTPRMDREQPSTAR